jgi:O-antigen ligase
MNYVLANFGTFPVWNAIEKTFVVLALLFFGDAGLSLIENPNRDLSCLDPTQSDPLRTVFALSVYLVLLVVALPVCGALVQALCGNKLLVSLVALSLISASWSPELLSSVKRAFLLLATTLFAAYCAVRFERLELLRLLSFALILAICASFAFALVIPAYGTQSDAGGAWRGIFSHKNQLGRFAVLSVIAFFFMSKRPVAGRWFWRVAIVLALGAIVLSRSATAAAVMMGVVICFLALGLFLLPQRLLIAGVFLAAAAGIAAVGLLSSNLKALFSFFGRDPTLTGRTELWSALACAIGKRPWLGYGYGGFWLGPGSESDSITKEVNWHVQHAHNGYLDLTLQLGYVGLIVFALLFLTYVRQAFRSARVHGAPLSLWPVCYFAFICLYNLSESTIVAHNNLFWVLFVAIGIQTGRGYAPSPAATVQRRVSSPAWIAAQKFPPAPVLT